jgi:RNA polymerase sigma-70 factor (ECF subfamily)
MTRAASTNRAGQSGRLVRPVAIRAAGGARQRPGSTPDQPARTGADTNGEAVASDVLSGGEAATPAVGHSAANRAATDSGTADHSAADHSAADGTWPLVEAAQRGDTTAFGELYDRYVDSVFRYVLFRVGDRTLAEDVTSETFLRALRRIGSLSYQGRDVGAWFVTIARNIVLDHVKSSRFKLEVATADPDDGDDHAAGPENQVITQLTHTELLRCVRQLGDDQRECIVLRFLQGLSVAETAELMGRNEGAVKALQHRAVRRLAQLLPEELR